MTMALAFTCHRVHTASSCALSNPPVARPRSGQGADTQHWSRPAPVQAVQSAPVERQEPAATAHQHRSSDESWEQEQLATRRQTHAQSSTSGSARLPHRRSSQPPHAQTAASLLKEDRSHLKLVSPPRRARAQEATSSSHAAAQHFSPLPLATEAPPPPVFSAGRGPRLLDEAARQLPAAVPNRIARLGRSLLHLPRGAVPGDVLEGQMLSSKQITGCAACAR